MILKIFKDNAIIAKPTAQYTELNNRITISLTFLNFNLSCIQRVLYGINAIDSDNNPSRVEIFRITTTREDYTLSILYQNLNLKEPNIIAEITIEIHGYVRNVCVIF